LREAEIQWLVTEKIAKPLDAIVSERAVDLPILAIKLDVEGQELKALAGARRLTEKYQPMFLIEGGAQTEPVHAFMTSSGYALANPSDPSTRVDRNQAGLNSLYVKKT